MSDKYTYRSKPSFRLNLIVNIIPQELKEEKKKLEEEKETSETLR
jgi:hypothetical protein